MYDIVQHDTDHEHIIVRYNMMTSSNRNVLLALCAGNSPVTDEFHLQRPVTRTFDFFY